MHTRKKKVSVRNTIANKEKDKQDCVYAHSPYTKNTYLWIMDTSYCMYRREDNGHVSKVMCAFSIYVCVFINN